MFEIDKKAMGGRIREALQAANAKNPARNQAWLARELGVAPAHISKMIKTGSVGVEALANICLLLQVSMDWIVFGSATRLPRAEEQFVKDLRALMSRAPSGIGGN
jgi:DNA-binding Xre family transcriptional regulator